MEKITYITDDIIIEGNYWPSTNGVVVILLHAMPATKESFTPFAEKLAAAGFGALAIDLRGHGKSKEKMYGSTTIPIDYSEFSDREHQDSINDVLAARGWLMKEGVAPGRILVGGASIGANLAIKYMAENPMCKAGFVLSPGKNYHGVETFPAVHSLLPIQHLFIIAAGDDDRVAEAVDQAEEIYSEATAGKKIKSYETGGHGTDIFVNHPECMDEIITWLLETT